MVVLAHDINEENCVIIGHGMKKNPGMSDRTILISCSEIVDATRAHLVTEMSDLNPKAIKELRVFHD